MRKTRILICLLLVFAMLPMPVLADSVPDHKDLARETVGEGVVLLKNDGALPLAAQSTVALFGNGQIYTGATDSGYQLGGGGSGAVTLDHTPKGPADVLLEAEADGKIGVYKPLTEAYRANAAYAPDDAMYTAAAENADTAIMFLSRFSTETADISPSEWYLSDGEEAMMKKLCSLFENVIVIVNAPSVIGTDWSLDNNSYGIDIEGLLIAYMGGEMGAYGIMDVLLGDVNPSGKLTDTYAMDIYDYPSTDTFMESDTYVRYTEDIYVGYRYFETFAPEKVAYPFGFGLSYTTFDVQAGDVTVENGMVNVPVTVRNTGSRAGKEVVQVYYSAPQAGTGSAVLSKSKIDLAAYVKTDLIAVGESQTVQLTFDVRDMASFDDTGISGHESCYVLEAGTYDIFVGTSARHIEKAGEYQVAALTVTQELSELCASTLDQRLIYNGTYERLDPAIVGAVNVSATVATVIEAESAASRTGNLGTENFADGAGWLRVGTEWKQIGTGICVGNFQSSPGAHLVYQLNVAQTGVYSLGIAAANGGYQLTDVQDQISFELSTDNGATWISASDNMMDSVNTRGVKSQTGYFYWNFVYMTSDLQGNAYELSLPSGNVLLRLTVSDTVEAGYSNINLDKLVLIPNGANYTEEQLYQDYLSTAGNGSLDFDKDQYQGILFEDVVSGTATKEAFLAQMSLNELIDLCFGHEKGLRFGQGTIGFSSNATGEKYGVYNADTNDGPAGVDAGTYFSTYWPCSTLQACTWNVDLIRRIGETVGEEALSQQVDIWLAPGMNIHRNPMCGRNFEYYSEDPVLTGTVAAALVKGTQSKDVACVIKHFCANNKETNRRQSDSRVSEKALREIYLKGFEITVRDADPMCVMTSYNPMNGIHTSGRSDLIRGILRGEWGYEGLVMSDWNTAIPITKEINAGNNVTMPTGEANELQASVRSGLLTRETLEENAWYVISALGKMQDYGVYRNRVITVTAEGTSTMRAVDFSRRALQLKFTAVGNTLATCYTETADADGVRGYLEYTLNAEAAGIYSLDMKYSRNAALEDAFEIYVNGAKVGGIQNDLASTGGFNNYNDHRCGDIYLNQGINVLRIQHVNASGANYLSFGLTLSSETECAKVESVQGTVGGKVSVNVLNRYEGLKTLTGTVQSDLDISAVFGRYVESYDPKTKTVTVVSDSEDGFHVGESLFTVQFSLPDSVGRKEYAVRLVNITLTDQDGNTYSGAEAMEGTVTVKDETVVTPPDSKPPVDGSEDTTSVHGTDDAPEPTKKGCFSVASIGGVWLPILIGAVWIRKKKRKQLS